jgi:uncharacterized membrane-anchored protein
MMRWLRIALAAQLAFFAGWGGLLLTSHRDAGVVWLATAPVDPRDLLSGHYVALRYPIAAANEAQCEPVPEDVGTRTVWVQLVPQDALATAEGAVAISTAVSCLSEPPPPASGVWIRGTLDRSGHIAYGIERMFVGEDNPLRSAQSGSVVAKVALNEVYEPRLLALVSTQAAPTTP